MLRSLSCIQTRYQKGDSSGKLVCARLWVDLDDELQVCVIVVELEERFPKSRLIRLVVLGVLCKASRALGLCSVSFVHGVRELG
jgi:hypothetical protein